MIGQQALQRSMTLEHARELDSEVETCARTPPAPALPSEDMCPVAIARTSESVRPIRRAISGNEGRRSSDALAMPYLRAHTRASVA